METFFKGLIMGFCIAAPVGPIGLLCIRRSITDGRLTGFISGLGAATADALYGFVAAFGLTAITQRLLAHRTWLQILGGLFLVVLGVKLARASRPQNTQREAPPRSRVSAYASTFLLTLANPATILSFVGIFAGLGVIAGTPAIAAGSTLVAGVFLGSAAWWWLLSSAAHWLGATFHPDRLHVINVVAGTLIAVFGAWQAAVVLRM